MTLKGKFLQFMKMAIVLKGSSEHFVICLFVFVSEDHEGNKSTCWFVFIRISKHECSQCCFGISQNMQSNK